MILLFNLDLDQINFLSLFITIGERAEVESTDCHNIEPVHGSYYHLDCISHLICNSSFLYPPLLSSETLSNVVVTKTLSVDLYEAAPLDLDLLELHRLAI